MKLLFSSTPRSQTDHSNASADEKEGCGFGDRCSISGNFGVAVIPIGVVHGELERVYIIGDWPVVITQDADATNVINAAR